MKREEFYLPSSDGSSKIHGVWWKTEKEPQAVLQISHGMIEHILRYEEFAETLAERGVAVVGHDHLGHGKTSLAEDLGYFGEAEGAEHILKDIHRISSRVKKTYPAVPHFLLGHSMGSFFLREYITRYGNELDGAVIMGTGNPPLALAAAGKFLAGLIKRWKGERYRSDLLHHLVLGQYNSRFLPAETEHDWLSRDGKKNREYEADPYCSFYFTCSAYFEFFRVILDLKRKRHFENIPEKLPVLVISGDCDPVGNFGKGVRQVYRQLQRLGMEDVTLKLYREGRHEILNEVNRENVYEDILSWIYAHIS